MLSDPCLKEMPIERPKKSNKSGQGHLSNMTQYGLWLQPHGATKAAVSSASYSVASWTQAGSAAMVGVLLTRSARDGS
jgi:hypothetical protein